MTYRYDSSYPFLAVAKKYGADYGDVLIVADFWQQHSRMLLPSVSSQRGEVYARLSAEARDAIIALCCLPVAERGGRHEN